MKHLIILLSVAILAISGILADNPWKGIWKTTPISTDPACCFPGSYIAIDDLFYHDLLLDNLFVYWASSAGCDAAGVRNKVEADQAVDNTTALSYQRLDIPITLTRDDISTNLTTKVGNTTCLATLTKTSVEWNGTYNLIPNSKANPKCCFADTFAISKDSQQSWQVSGEWQQTDACITQNLTGEIKNTKAPEVILASFQFWTTNFDPLSQAHQLFSLWKYEQDLVQASIGPQESLLECDGIYQEVRPVNSVTA